MKKLANNKGAAMVTVLIAITFISILATSLLYMAYMNYTTKSMRYSATDNFYTDEFALDDLATSIQQIAANASTITQAKTDIRTACGVSSPSGYAVYDNNAVAALIQVASTETGVASISVNTAVPTDATGYPLSANYIEGGSTIKLLGVSITTTTATGYMSTIVSDIVLTFPNTGPGGMDVNDFSIITDSCIDIQAGDVILGGNVFLRQGASDPYALHVASGAICTLLSEKGIIDGDVIVDGTGVLVVTGDVTVIGDININDQAVLMATGDLKYTGSLTGGGTIKGTPEQKPLTQEQLDALPDDGMASSLYTSFSVIGSTGASYTFETDPSAGTYSIEAWFDKVGAAVLEAQTTLKDPETSALFGSDIYYRGQLGLPTGAFNGSAQDGYSVLVLTRDDVTVRKDCRNSTLVTTGKLIFDINTDPTVMTMMSDEAYEAVKNQLITGNVQIMELGNADMNVSFAGGTTASIPTSASDLQELTYSSGSETRRAVYANGHSYLSIGDFLRDDASSFISNVFNAIGGEQHPDLTIVSYENWYKE